MFGFFKKKLKEATEKFSRKIEEEGKEELPEEPVEGIIEEPVEEDHQKPVSEELLPQPLALQEEPVPSEPVLSSPEKPKETPKENIFTAFKKKVSTKKITSEQFEDFFFDLEVALLENNVALEVIEKIKEELKMDLVDVLLPKHKIESRVKSALDGTLKSVLEDSSFDLIKDVQSKQQKPYVVLFVGVNGSGKTTTIAKIASYLKKHHLSCVLAAADTFRAASIEQLEEHGKNLGIKVIKHTYGADPGAVVYDAKEHAKARHIDVVLIDTAGRQHSNEDLMHEMKKINQVAQPDLTLFVGESITGNDCVEQIKNFGKFVDLDGIILSKLDIDEKGGAALSISYVSGKPIFFVGTGQSYDDLQKFDSSLVLEHLGL